MRNNSKNLALLAITIACNAAPAEAADYLAPASLCQRGEKQYFSCELQGSRKIASICAANNTSPDHGYVQYRFGTQRKIEYTFPRALTPPRGNISIVDVSRLPDGLGSHLKFSNGPYTYIVSTALVPGAVYVVKDNTVVFDGVCKGNAYIPFSNTARQGLEYGISD
ncbi:hypothetical protein PBS_48720 [Paraburkholderia sp. 2C]